MSWRDRDYRDNPSDRFGRPGGDWQGIRPTFDNPMTWALPIGRYFGIAVRVHIVFLLFVVIQLASSLGSEAPLAFSLMALYLGCLFGVVLLHEFGHCLACRWTGGKADEILMWPLGGLAFCRPEHHWRAHLATAVGGPAVNVVICVVLAPVLGLMTGEWWGVAVPSLLGLPYFELKVAAVPLWLTLTLFTVHQVSFVLLLFNLLPIFPLDGGRICQAGLWPRWGYVTSMRLAVYVGYIGAIGLFVFGAVLREWMVIAIAGFGGITCYLTLKQLQFTEAFMGEQEDLYAQSLWGKGEDADEHAPAGRKGAEKRAETQAETEARESAEVDRILAKIAASGMGSLSGREKRLLRRVTDRKKRQEG